MAGFSLPHYLQFGAWVFGAAVAISVFAAVFAMMIGLIERKLIGRIHSRYGPTMVGPFGSLQTAADAIKFMQKEILIPRRAHALLFLAAPILMIVLPFVAFAFLPWGPFTFIKSDYDVLAIVAILALNPILILFATWASNNKYSAIGGLRAVSQTLAYEVVLFAALLSVFFASGSFRLSDIVSAQKDLWFIVTQPIAFVLLLFALIAISERQPLDLPEAESEIVQGWLTEYGGPLFAVILLSQYMTFYIIAFASAAIFLGGWVGPLGWWGFAAKIFFAALIFMVSRATYFRLRLDQLLNLSWRFLMPLGFANFFVTILLPGLWFDR